MSFNFDPQLLPKTGKPTKNQFQKSDPQWNGELNFFCLQLCEFWAIFIKIYIYFGLYGTILHLIEFFIATLLHCRNI